MLKPEQIPDEVVEAAVAMRDRGGSMSDIIRTAINAWQTDKHKMIVGKAMNEVGGVYPALILPLPKEAPDAES